MKQRKVIEIKNERHVKIIYETDCENIQRKEIIKIDSRMNSNYFTENYGGIFKNLNLGYKSTI